MELLLPSGPVNRPAFIMQVEQVKQVKLFTMQFRLCLCPDSLLLVMSTLLPIDQRAVWKHD